MNRRASIVIPTLILVCAAGLGLATSPVATFSSIGPRASESRALALTADGSILVAVNPDSNSVSILDTETLVRLARRTGAVVTVAWVTLGGVNTGADEVEALGHLLRHTKVRVNLIDVNDARVDGYPRAEDGERDAFRDRLRALGISTIRRYSGGAARHAACGMLANVRSTPVAGRPSPE